MGDVFKSYLFRESAHCDAARIRRVHGFDILREEADVELIGSPRGERVKIKARITPSRFDFVADQGSGWCHVKKNDFLSRWVEVK